MIFPAVILFLTALVAAQARVVPVHPGLELHCNDDGEDCTFEGDIEIDPDDIVEGDILEDAESARNIVKDQKKTWPNGVVPFAFHSSVTQADREKIKEAMKGIEDVSCVKFKQWTPKLGVEYLLQISSAVRGCYSYIGFGGYDTYIGLINIHPKECKDKGAIQHEFLHTLGFLHEQSRPDRDKYVEIIWDNIQEGQEHNFEIANATEYQTFGVPYNVRSIMHYPAYSHSKNFKPTIKALDGTHPREIGQSTRMQRTDIQKLNLLYKCKV